MKKLFTLLTLLLVVGSGAWADAITVTWLPNDMSSVTMTGTASVNDILTVSDIALSSDVEAASSLNNWDSKKWVTFLSKTVSTAAGPKNGINKDDYLTFTVTVKTGYTFYPTGITAYAVGNGTGNNGVGLFTEILSENISSGYTATNSSSASSVSQMSKTITSSAITEGNTYTFYIYFSQNNTSNGKGVGMRDVVLTGTYEVAGMTKLDTPSITVNQTTGQVTIGSVANATKITYTTDGTDPTASSTTYSAPFTVDANCTIKAIAIGDGTSYSNSNIASQTANITVENPVITAYNGTVGITCATDGATIKYNFDGGETWETYTIPFTLFEGQTVYAKAEHASYKSNSATVTTAVAAAPAAASDSKSITLYYDIETNFSLNTDGNSDVLTGKANTDYEGFSITLDNEGQSGSNIKTISYGSSINGKTSLKGSNGRKMTIAIPSNLRANRITLYSYNNGTISSDSYWSKVGGTAYTTANEISLQSVSDASNPDVRVFALDNLTSIDIVNNGAQQQCFIAVVDYTTYVPGPEDAEVSGYEVAATITTSTGSISGNTWTMTANSDYTFKSVSVKSSTTDFKIDKNGTYTITVPSEVAVAKLDITGYSSSGDGTTLTVGSTIETFPNSSTTKTYTIASPTDGASITFTTGGKEMEISEIKLYVANAIVLTTTDNMAGWRAFYDASNGYTLDANTTAYVATANDGSTVTMTPLAGGVPAGTPVVLKTTSSADNYKMTLTKASVSAYEGTNLLTWTTSAVDSKYRLGYGESGVGFYPYSGTPASGAVILNVSSASARALTISFNNEETGISIMNNSESRMQDKVFDLSGRKVAQPTRGLYIMNGKKVVIK